MNKFDEQIKIRAAQAPIEMPDDLRHHIEHILAELPEEPEYNASYAEDASVIAFHQKRRYMRYATTAACMAFALFFVMPNLSMTYASAMAKVPILGEVIEVLTIRTYNYEDGSHEMTVNVPGIESDTASAEKLNTEIAVFTDQIVAEFYDSVETYGSNSYGSLSVDHSVITNTDRWFSMRLIVTEIAASSYTYYAYYHIDKQTGEIVHLGDLFEDDAYIDVLTKDIKAQIEDQMAKDDSISYFIDDPMLGDDFITIYDEHNFYINDNGKLVIPFDEYEIAPGYMGCPEFEIPTKVFKSLLKNEYKEIFS